MYEFVDSSPEEIVRYFDLWLAWRITGKKFLLHELLQEPDNAWNVIHEIDDNYERLLAIYRAQIKDNNG